MAASFKKVDPRIWDDEVFDELSIEEAFAALWLITSRVKNRAGVAVFSLVLAAEKLRAKGIDTVWDTLSAVSSKLGWPMERLSRNKVVVILRTHFRYNPPSNPKHLAGMLSDLSDVPRCTVITKYFETVRDDIDERWREHFDAMFERVSDTLSEGYRYRMVYPPHARARAREVEGDVEVEEETPNPLGKGDTVSLRAGERNPRAAGTNPRALAKQAAAEDERLRARLIAKLERHADRKLEDGTRIERGGLYDRREGTLTWNRVPTRRLVMLAKSLERKRS